ncbi:MAG: CHAD domain-containing protein [Verrucomicrobiales bacterium]|nr:CHAD domain-containing protein [Verrucomicrobiales bacterium]
MKPKLPRDLVAHLQALLRRVRRRRRRRLEDAQKHWSPTPIHELRVETRRTLALLDLLQALGFEAAGGKTRRMLKRQLDAFDALRDVQVGQEWLSRWLARFPEARPLARYLRRREKELCAALRKKLHRLKPRRPDKALKALARDLQEAAADDVNAGEVLRRPLQRAAARVMRFRRQIRPPDTQAIHRTRVAFKKLRYLCESLQPWLPGLSARRLRRMRTWQTRMGEIQDIRVLLGHMEEAVREGAVDLAAVRRLHAALNASLARRVQRLHAVAHRLDEFRPEFGPRRARRTRRRTTARTSDPGSGPTSQPIASNHETVSASSR